MCDAQKCCFIVPLHVGSYILGLGTLIASVCWTGTAAVLLNQELDYQKVFSPSVQKHILRLNLNNASIDFMLAVSLILGVLWILVSMLLIFGLQNNKPNLLLTYFGFGTLLTILGQLSGLLLLLNNLWWIALPVFILFGIHTHFLVVVHTAYDQMSKGRTFSFNRRVQLDESPIMEDY